MRSAVPTDVPPYFWTISDTRSGRRAKGDRRVRAAEPERVRQRGPDRHRPREARHAVEVALRVDVDQVRSRRRDLMAYCERGEDRLDAGRGAKQMAGHRLRRRHG